MKLKDARLARNLTQDELAEKSGVTQANISSIERGTIQSPSWETVAKLSRALRVKPEELFPVAERVTHG